MEGHIYLQFQPGAGKIRSNSLSMCQTLGHFFLTLSWTGGGISIFQAYIKVKYQANCKISAYARCLVLIVNKCNFRDILFS